MHSVGCPARKIGAVTVEVRTRACAIAEVLEAVEKRSARVFGFCNAHTVNLARSSPDFAQALSEMTLFNDGVGVDLGSRILHSKAFPENLNGTDLMPAVLGRLPAGTRVFLVGSTNEVANAARRALSASFPRLDFCGAIHGFFPADEDRQIAAQIGDCAARLVLVGMGQPRQELWAVRHGTSSGATLMCVGAYLDFAAGRFARAPALLRRLRLEWLFRLLLEPQRLWRRYLIGNAAFLWHVAGQRLRSGQ